MKKKKVTFKGVVKSSKPTLVEFYATWCGPCQAMMPAIKEVSQRVGDSAKVIKIDIDRNQKLANKLNIRSVPTLMIYKEGKVVWRQTGGMSAKQLERAINEFVN